MNNLRDNWHFTQSKAGAVHRWPRSSSATIPYSCLDGCPCPGGKWSISLDRKPVVWFSRVLSKPPDRGLLDQPIAHHRRRKRNSYIFGAVDSAKKNNLESNLIVRPQVPNVCLCDEERLMNVKEKRQLSSVFVFFKVSMNVKQKRSAIIINIYQRPVQGYKLTAHFEWSMTLSKVFYCWEFLNTKIQNSLNCLLSISSSFQKWLPTSCISELRKIILKRNLVINCQWH